MTVYVVTQNGSPVSVHGSKKLAVLASEKLDNVSVTKLVIERTARQKPAENQVETLPA